MIRDDLTLAAFAVANGFALQTDRMGERGDKLGPQHFDTVGIPHDGLQFNLGRWHVWQTSRGWRVAALSSSGSYASAQDGDFHAKLFAALRVAIACHGQERAAAPADAVECQDCDWRGRADDCAPLRDVLERVSPGETMPAGECPKCGAVAHLIEGEGN